jgi:oxygen-dependent protoporphyrinogen oxidase
VSSELKDRHVVVVGAGLAGLAAAGELRERGARVTVLERADRPGGRATSDVRDDCTFDSGAQLISAADSALEGLVRAAGLEHRLLPLKPFLAAQLYEGAPRPIDTSHLLGVARLGGVSWREALRWVRLGRLHARFGDLLSRDAPEHGVRLDDRSVADFVRLYFGRTVLERWAAPLVEAWGHGDVEQTSRVQLLRFHALRDSTWQGTLRGGLGELAQVLSERCEVQLGVAVESVEARAGGGFTVRPATPAEPIEADAVVLATRADAALRLAGDQLAPAECDVLAATTYSPSIVMHAVLDEPLVDVATRVRIPAAEGLPLLAIAHEVGSPGGRVPEGVSAVSLVATPAWSAAHLEAADEVIEKELLTVLDRPHAGASARVEQTDLRRHRQALPLFPVGRYRELATLRRVAADRRAAGRRIYLAGDYLADPTLDGAVRSGMRAAAELAADFRQQ